MEQFLILGLPHQKMGLSSEYKTNQDETSLKRYRIYLTDKHFRVKIAQ